MQHQVSGIPDLTLGRVKKSGKSLRNIEDFILTNTALLMYWNSENNKSISNFYLLFLHQENYVG